jgi:UDP-N-acetylmuramoyl-tripeptide--D-alanyl-D-alanine ligase
MTATFTGEEILDICKGRLAAGLMPEDAGAICTDTRLVKDGDWYLALAGETFDGHDFLGDAFAAGAIGAIVNERPNYAIGNAQFPLIAVEDTLEAYHALARNWRRRINPFVIGVTGSSGKTTTKEMCAAVMSAGFRTHKSRSNENNEYGVPKTLLAMPDDTQVAVIEMAMRGLHQIELLAKCAMPNVGIITNAGTAHLELLGSLENIAKAKSELVAQLNPEKGVAIIGHPTLTLLTAVNNVFKGKTLLCEDMEISVVSVDEDSTKFQTSGSDTVFEVHAHGMPLLEDAWCVIMAAREMKLSEDLIAQGLKSFHPVGGRGDKMLTADGALVLNETYNANPDSVKASVSGMLDDRAFPYEQKIVVIGELAELGPTEKDLHRELGEWFKDKKLNVLMTVGSLARHVAEGAQGAAFEVIPCADQDEAERLLKAKMNSKTCILIKGSRRANLDKLVNKLVGSPAAS